QIRIRVLGFDHAINVDEALIEARVEAALAFRAQVLPVGLDAMRLVHGESDELPGAVVDRYADTAVIQCNSTAAEQWRDAIVSGLVEAGCTTVYERSDAEVRVLEGLPARAGLLYGTEPPATITINEGAARYLVDVRHGQKTGFYLDQRDNRAAVASAAGGREVLDVFCYTGGFSVAALVGGAARVTALDSSAEALARARANV